MKFTKVKILKRHKELAYKEGDSGVVLTNKLASLIDGGFVEVIKERSAPIRRKKTTKKV